jgi:hypothetical protein
MHKFLYLNLADSMLYHEKIYMAALTMVHG